VRDILGDNWVGIDGQTNATVEQAVPATSARWRAYYSLSMSSGLRLGEKWRTVGFAPYVEHPVAPATQCRRVSFANDIGCLWLTTRRPAGIPVLRSLSRSDSGSIECEWIVEAPRLRELCTTAVLAVRHRSFSRARATQSKVTARSVLGDPGVRHTDDVKPLDK